MPEEGEDRAECPDCGRGLNADPEEHGCPYCEEADGTEARRVVLVEDETPYLERVDDAAQEASTTAAEPLERVEELQEEVDEDDLAEHPFSYELLGPEDGDEEHRELAFRVQGSRPLGDATPELIQKICDARVAIEEKGKVPQSGYNERIDHRYSTYDDVNGHVARPLAEAGVWLESSMVDSARFATGSTTRGGNPIYKVVAIMEVRLTDGDAWIGRRVMGENKNAGDKHFYALESQLLRYALSKMLLLESGDPEVDQDPESAGTQATAESTEQADPEDMEDPSGSQMGYIKDLREKCRDAGVPTKAGDMSDDPHRWDTNAMRGKPRAKKEASKMIDKLNDLKDQATLTGGDGS